VGGHGGGEFFATVEAELRQAAKGACSGPIDTLYIGGGTPSFVDPGRIGELIACAAGCFGLDGRAEITLEANPEGVDSRKARRWLAAGVNRLSLGIQSLSDEVLRPRGRLYDAEAAMRALHTARDAGFSNVSADLIAGLPGESLSSFRAGLERLADAAPDHVSVYLLETAESGKTTSLSAALEAGRVRGVDEQDVVDMYRAATTLLPEAGWKQYEISNFARPGFESRHNLKYWESSEWIGAGPSAHSHAGGRRWSRPAAMDRWMDQVRAGEPGSDHTLPDAAARVREALVLELRLARGVHLPAFARRWSFDAEAELAGPFEELITEGLLRRRGDRIALSPRGILFSNEVFGRLA